MNPRVVVFPVAASRPPHLIDMRSRPAVWTDGMYCAYSPYENDSDDLLASTAQLAIFFSLVASIVTNAYPNE